MLKGLTFFILIATAGYLVFITLPYKDTSTRLVDAYDVECEKGDQESDYYFDPKERFSDQPHLIDINRRAGTIKPNRYSEASTYYSIRPLHAQLVMPRNVLLSFHRRCMPWAKQYWDLLLVEVLWPDLRGRTEDNEPFTGITKSVDAIFLTIGNIHSETDHLDFNRREKTKLLTLVAEHHDIGISEYKVSENISSESSTYLVNKDVRTTYLGNPIILACHWPAVHGNPEKEHECSTRFVLPSRIWPPDHFSQQYLKDGTGLEVQIRFHHSHIRSWQEIYSMVVEMIDRALIDADLGKSPNKSSKRDAVTGAPS